MMIVRLNRYIADEITEDVYEQHVTDSAIDFSDVRMIYEYPFEGPIKADKKLICLFIPPYGVFVTDLEFNKAVEYFKKSRNKNITFSQCN